jgi:hypothetical protein
LVPFTPVHPSSPFFLLTQPLNTLDFAVNSEYPIYCLGILCNSGFSQKLK